MHEYRADDSGDRIAAGNRETESPATKSPPGSSTEDLIQPLSSEAGRRNALRSMGAAAVAFLSVQTLAATGEAARKHNGRDGKKSNKGENRNKKRNAGASRRAKSDGALSSAKKGKKKPKPGKPFSSQVSFSNGTVSVNSSVDLSATCPAGKAVLGCGFEKPDNSFDITLVALAADTELRRCTGRFSRNNSNPGALGAIEVTAICVG